MKITLEPSKENIFHHSTIIIDSGYDDMDILQVWEELIKPALVGWGFSEKTVDSLISDDED